MIKSKSLRCPSLYRTPPVNAVGVDYSLIRREGCSTRWSSSRPSGATCFPSNKATAAAAARDTEHYGSSRIT